MTAAAAPAPTRPTTGEPKPSEYEAALRRLHYWLTADEQGVMLPWSISKVRRLVSKFNQRVKPRAPYWTLWDYIGHVAGRTLPQPNPDLFSYLTHSDLTALDAVSQRQEEEYRMSGSAYEAARLYGVQGQIR